MSALLTQLGINWKLLLAQGINFGLLVVVLTLFVYRPLLKLMKERREKIEFGLKGAEEAAKRLVEIEVLKAEKLKAADKTALGIVSAAEDDAKHKAQGILADASKRAESVIADAKVLAERKEKENFAELERRAAELVKAALLKTVELDPKAVDEKLVSDAIRAVAHKS